jgi:hypothetical protein
VRVVRDHLGTNWAAEIGHRTAWMKLACQNHINHGGRVLPPVEIRHWSTKCRRNTARAGKKRWRTGKATCKIKKPDENDQNHKMSPPRSLARHQLENPFQIGLVQGRRRLWFISQYAVLCEKIYFFVKTKLDCLFITLAMLAATFNTPLSTAHAQGNGVTWTGGNASAT